MLLIGYRQRFGKMIWQMITTTTYYSTIWTKSSTKISRWSKSKLTTLKSGTNLSISCCQLWSVDAGDTTRNGPQTPSRSATWHRNAMHCTVLPRPISSAKMPLIPWEGRNKVHFTLLQNGMVAKLAKFTYVHALYVLLTQELCYWGSKIATLAMLLIKYNIPCSEFYRNKW